MKIHNLLSTTAAAAVLACTAGAQQLFGPGWHDTSLSPSQSPSTALTTPAGSAASAKALDDSDATTRTFLAVDTYDDLLDPVPTTTVLVEQAGSSSWVVSDAVGQTPFVEVAVDTPTMITMFETSTTTGLVLGQRKEIMINSVGGVFDARYHSEFTFQPIAIPVTIDQYHVVAPSPYHSMWWFQRDSYAASYSFQANVGILLNPSEIQGFFDYYNTGIGATQQRALVIRCGNDVDLGGAGLAVAIKYHGPDDGTLPQVDTLWIDPVSGQVQADPFTAYAVQYDAGDERLYVHVDGLFQSGNNLILLHGPGSDAFNGGSDGGDSGGTGGGGGGDDGVAKGPFRADDNDSGGTPVDCTPTAPTPPAGLSCAPPKPRSHGVCPDTVASGSAVCGTTTVMVAGPICDVAGVNKGAKETKRVKGSSSLKASLLNIEIGAGTEFEQSVESNLNSTFGPGVNGCGQCFAQFVHVTVCAQTWTVRNLIGWFILECDSKTETTKCFQMSAPTGNSCDRTCQ